MTLLIRGLPTAHFHHLLAGGPDANGQAPLRRPAVGLANPCRHCLQLIAPGEDKLVLNYRPFDELQPYAESGPIFLHARECTRYESRHLPDWFAHLNPALVRGYDAQHWIAYDTAAVLPGAELAAACQAILARPGIAYAHVRSRFNCFQCRVERAPQ
jgi:hypothetical protein